MRRKDREMSREFALEVIDKAPFVNLSMVNNNKPYAVPVSIVREGNHLYFHCALKGQKIDALENNNNVMLTGVRRCLPRPEDFTLEYESAVIEGCANKVEDEEEKIYALRLICEKYASSNMANFDSAVNKSLDRTNVIKIVIENIYGKRKKYSSDGTELKYGEEEKKS